MKIPFLFLFLCLSFSSSSDLATGKVHKDEVKNVKNEQDNETEANRQGDVADAPVEGRMENATVEEPAEYDRETKNAIDHDDEVTDDVEKKILRIYHKVLECEPDKGAPEDLETFFIDLINNLKYAKNLVEIRKGAESLLKTLYDDNCEVSLNSNWRKPSMILKIIVSHLNTARALGLLEDKNGILMKLVERLEDLNMIKDADNTLSCQVLVTDPFYFDIEDRRAVIPIDIDHIKGKPMLREHVREYLEYSFRKRVVQILGMSKGEMESNYEEICAIIKYGESKKKSDNEKVTGEGNQDSINNNVDNTTSGDHEESNDGEAKETITKVSKNVISPIEGEEPQKPPENNVDVPDLDKETNPIVNSGVIPERSELKPYKDKEEIHQSNNEDMIPQHTKPDKLDEGKLEDIEHEKVQTGYIEEVSASNIEEEEKLNEEKQKAQAKINLRVYEFLKGKDDENGLMIAIMDAVEMLKLAINLASRVNFIIRSVNKVFDLEIIEIDERSRYIYEEDYFNYEPREVKTEMYGLLMYHLTLPKLPYKVPHCKGNMKKKLMKILNEDRHKNDNDQLLKKKDIKVILESFKPPSDVLSSDDVDIPISDGDDSDGSIDICLRCIGNSPDKVPSKKEIPSQDSPSPLLEQATPSQDRPSPLLEQATPSQDGPSPLLEQETPPQDNSPSLSKKELGPQDKSISKLVSKREPSPEDKKLTTSIKDGRNPNVVFQRYMIAITLASISDAQKIPEDLYPLAEGDKITCGTVVSYWETYSEYCFKNKKQNFLDFLAVYKVAMNYYPLLIQKINYGNRFSNDLGLRLKSLMAADCVDKLITHLEKLFKMEEKQNINFELELLNGQELTRDEVDEKLRNACLQELRELCERYMKSQHKNDFESSYDYVISSACDISLLNCGCKYEFLQTEILQFAYGSADILPRVEALKFLKGKGTYDDLKREIMSLHSQNATNTEEK